MIAPTTMLYRSADKPNPDVWGWHVEHGVFANADVQAALATGWSLHPLDALAAAGEPEQRGDAEVIALEPKRRGRSPKGG